MKIYNLRRDESAAVGNKNCNKCHSERKDISRKNEVLADVQFNAALDDPSLLPEMSKIFKCQNIFIFVNFSLI